jgi:asparagine synthase (glutamine-hydrolysing)
MCGFSGWIVDSAIGANQIVLSLQAIKHRGPDDTRIVSGDDEPTMFSCSLSNAFSSQNFPSIHNQASKICFGFNRLSIVDLSDKAMQPFYDNDSNQLFMLNGEIYNYVELRNSYLSDVDFVSVSDTEVAFQLYKKLGVSFVELLKGMFSIVIYDYNSSKLKVWRDRLGIKPFYYTLTDNGLFFSSEMKGLFAIDGIGKELNYTGLAYSMYLGTCPSPLTIYKNIHTLQSGHYLQFDSSTHDIEVKPYWTLKYEPCYSSISSNTFNNDIEKICELYATDDVEKAIMLSGGLDSGTLAYFYGKYSDSMQAVHIHNDNPNSEFEFAQLNAQHAGVKINNYNIPLTFSSNEIEFLLNSEEEPNISPEPALVLCEKINDLKIKVLYNALGPDELFGGYAYYQIMSKYSRWRLLLMLPLCIFPKKHQHKIKEIQEHGLDAFPFIARQIFTWNEVKKFLIDNNQSIPTHPIAYIQSQIQQAYPQFSNLPLLKKASYYDIFYYISSHHTFRCDQPSMLFSVEMRFPFLEHTFIEKYFNQADTFNEINKSLKPVFRNYIKPLLSPDVLAMKKQGFGVDIAQLFPSTKHKHADKQWYLMMLKRITENIK